MKSNAILFVLGVLITLGNVTRPNLGLVAPTSAQAIGYDVIPLLGYFLIVYSVAMLLKKKKPEETKTV